MNKENTEYLWNKYPKIFQDKNADIRTSLIPFGFECHDGWFWLIDRLCSSIQGYIDNNNKEQVIATQVKEKFGSLSFYCYGGDDVTFGMIWLAEHMSRHTCEECGSTKDIGHTTGWITSLCEKCVEEKDIQNWKRYKESIN